MSSSAIDQALPIAPPVRSVAEPVRPTVSDRPAFQEHLERAANETPPTKSTEPVDSNQNDLTTTDQQQNAASSQEEETLATADSSAADAETSVDRNQEGEPDAVEISDAAVLLADAQAQPQNETVVASEQVPPVGTKSEDHKTVKENRSPQALDTENKDSAESKSAGKSAVPIEASAETTSAEQAKSKGENQDRTEKATAAIEVPAGAANTTPEKPANEPLADTRKKNKSADKKISTTAADSAASGKQPAPGAVEGKAPASGTIVDQGLVKQQKVPQDAKHRADDTKTKTQNSQEQPGVPSPENRPSVAASVPTPESTQPTTPLPTNLGNEAPNFTSQPSGNSTAVQFDAATDTEPVPTADRVKFIKRVGGAIRSGQNRDGKIHLQLRPPELGSLRIEIAVKQGVLTAHLETETSAARTIILDNLPALREHLAGQQIRIEKFDVDVRDEGGQQANNPGSDDRQANHSPRDFSGQHQNTRQTKQAVRSAPVVQSPTKHVGGLDVSI